MDARFGPFARARLLEECRCGTFIAPVAYVVGLAAVPNDEVFGPILHVVRWKADELDQVLAAIRVTGYGLTLGLHSRIGSFQERVAKSLAVGNVSVNRPMIGAVVGAQPFGGVGLSGTGPKAGGPFYLHRFAREVATSVNTAAIGGDIALMSRGRSSGRWCRRVRNHASASIAASSRTPRTSRPSPRG
ncbi:MAG: aldehyde dehydrogenase family protein [Alphaproteobacteria bacterium]|nr:aldehyde dehydrogenase family protein [Alphaproteobacteria bacterium]